MNLLESYRKRLAVSESVYKKAHNGLGMDSNKKLVVATCLDNISKLMNESFDSASATQRSDMGLFKKFCLNLVTVALPNLISHELVIVHPMTSMSGYITYVNYEAGTSKGQTEQGDLFNNPFMLGDVNPNYTANAVVEDATAGADHTPMWNPVCKKSFHVITVNGEVVEFDPMVGYTADELATQEWYDVKIKNDGVVTYAYLEDGVVPAAKLTGTDSVQVAYKYDNVVVPQEKLPTLKAEMKSIPLIAKARRIAVYYSQIAAFQAKTDYGFDLGDQLAEKAVGQLSYEIDTEVVNLLDRTAGDAVQELVWSRTLPVGVSKAEHYEGFSEIVEIAAQKIYDATKRFSPNYMVIASDIKPVLTFIKGWSAAPAGQINGPYFAGTLNGLKVFVSPALAPGRFLVGVNGDDLMSSVAVYAPYMAIVPTQLLQFADGANSQGFSTMYDLKVLNRNLIVAGEVTK